MYIPEKLDSDVELRERALRDLEYGARALSAEEQCPTVVQLGGRDIDELVRAAKLFEGHCEGIDINAGCPQRHALKGGYGSSLLARKEWHQLEHIGDVPPHPSAYRRPLIACPAVSSLSNTLSVPVSVKLRLCSPPDDTAILAEKLQNAGASHIALHARFPNVKHRRHGAAQLKYIRDLKCRLDVPVLSNGNVRTFEDVRSNLCETGADGVLVGEELLHNP